jgi:hypothetical protein
MNEMNKTTIERMSPSDEWHCLGRGHHDWVKTHTPGFTFFRKNEVIERFGALGFTVKSDGRYEGIYLVNSELRITIDDAGDAIRLYILYGYGSIFSVMATLLAKIHEKYAVNVELGNYNEENK